MITADNFRVVWFLRPATEQQPVVVSDASGFMLDTSQWDVTAYGTIPTEQDITDALAGQLEVSGKTWLQWNQARTRDMARAEAVRRMRLENDLFDSVDAYLAFEAVFTTLIAAVPTLTGTLIANNLQEPLASIKAIRDAYMSMRTEINALTTVEDCESYITGIAADTASSPRTINWP